MNGMSRKGKPQAVTAEEVVAARLERRIGALPLGTRLRLMLEQDVDVFDGVRWRPGPHVAGWVERPTPSVLRIRLIPTAAGRTAEALLEEELLAVVLSRGVPPSIRLTANAEVFD
jgi:hypothetical protein